MTTAVQEVETPTTTTSDKETRTQVTNTPVSGPVTIPVTLSEGMTPDQYFLAIPDELKYISLIEDYDNDITWNLQPAEGIDAFFDTPAVTFPGQNTGSTLVEKTLSSVKIHWTNTVSERRGLSFYYTLHAVVNNDGLLIPVNLDPTMHNEPPT